MAQAGGETGFHKTKTRDCGALYRQARASAGEGNKDGECFRPHLANEAALALLLERRDPLLVERDVLAAIAAPMPAPPPTCSRRWLRAKARAGPR